MSKDEIINSFQLELRRGTIVLCVLAKLKKPAYGYSLITELSKSGISMEANTLYPLLRRLEGQGLLVSSWSTDSTKPRKYYVTTEFGKELLPALQEHWLNAVNSMEKILEVDQNENKN